MSRAPRVVVITSCTNLKTAVPSDQPLAAEALYSGEQHKRLMRGVHAYRACPEGEGLELRILSAGYGLVRGDEALASYDETFATLPASVIRDRALELGIPEATRELLSQPYAFALILLGADYMRTIEWSADMSLGGPTLAVCGNATARSLPPLDGFRTLPSGKAEARRFSCGLVGLKGEIGARILEGLAARRITLEKAIEGGSSLLDQLDPSKQGTLAAVA